MFPIPVVAKPLAEAMEKAFTQPTWQRFLALMMGWIMTMGRRTVSRALRVSQPLLPGHWSNYHRLLSAARFSLWVVAAALVRQVIALLPREGTIELVADDTITAKSGQRVWAKGPHRDPLRSRQGHTQIKFGHKWLVLCVLVRLPGARRPWALPILCGLCLSPKVAKKLGRRPKTASQLARQLLLRLLRWLPERTFILTGDYQVVTHATVALAQRYARRVTAVGRLRDDANLYAPPVNPNRRVRCGGRARKGRKLPSPAVPVGQLTPRRREVAWYGGSRQRVKFVTATGLWYDKQASAVTPIRWVAVLGDERAGRETAYFFSSDPEWDAERIIEHYAARWNIEVTFEEARAHLGLETSRHWCRRSVLRGVPLLLGLFTAVVLLWRRLPARRRGSVTSDTPCYAKTSITFADALYAVRQELWENSFLAHCDKHQCLTQLPRRVRRTILWHLAAAA